MRVEIINAEGLADYCEVGEQFEVLERHVYDHVYKLRGPGGRKDFFISMGRTKEVFDRQGDCSQVIILEIKAGSERDLWEAYRAITKQLEQLEVPETAVLKREFPRLRGKSYEIIDRLERS
ncbi:hypothetical protein [Listeria ilorinensis]|uniref:hypothetical protein n=1 Tax=Listeria ilorinensis TaxID=2867439 RepID=UPI001EF42C46|nr:hypothetical protein [Listeria ilorinensis]